MSNALPCISTSTEAEGQSSQKPAQKEKISPLRGCFSYDFGRSSYREHFLSMSRRLTILVLAIWPLLQHASFAAIKERDAEPRKLSEEEARALAIYAPIPRYPREARAKHMQGSRPAVITVDRQTGYVRSARMLQSTEHQILDDEAVKAFRTWRFKPGTVSVVRIPVLFGMRRTQLVPGGGAMYGLKPEYPSEARAKGLTGSGVVLLKIDARTGYVTSASMSKKARDTKFSITQPCELFGSGVSDQEV